MQFQVPIHIAPLTPPIDYQQKIMLIGSCFTEHIGNYLHQVKLNVLQNPHGILFDPIAVCNSLERYISQHEYQLSDLFQLNDAWHNWEFHTRFSHYKAEVALKGMNASVSEAHHFLKNADWLIITLGSSFIYQLVHEQFKPVANCHKAPAQTFQKHMSTIEAMITALDSTLYKLFHFNPKLKVIFTISPVRHIRDGVVDNNRSKARLLETVHHLVQKFNRLYYFPAYELVIDVLRDYRFYDVDMAHPNYQATQFVLSHFTQTCFTPEAQQLMNELQKIQVAYKHKPLNPYSEEHRKFLLTMLQKVQQLQAQYPNLPLADEAAYFATIPHLP